MLSDTSRPIIEATAPVVAERIPFITPKFYQRMFGARPDLLDGMFSRSNQLTGEQPKALAGSIVAFATWLLTHPDSYPETVLSRIAHKHASLGLQEDEYPTVYEHLFGAIAADLGDAATPEVVDAWTEVYWLMGHALISMEKNLYASQANDRPFAPWTVTGKEMTGGNVAVISFAPADDTAVSDARPGQYVSLQVPTPDGTRQARQFTLIPSPAGARRIAVKLDPNGEVTPLIHEKLQVGDVYDLSNPYGDLVLREVTVPLVLASAGIGVTPMLALLDALKQRESQREIIVLHADRTSADWPLADEMTALVDALPNARIETWFEEGADGDHRGLMDLSGVAVPADANVVMCGPLPFLKAVRSQLIASGHPAEQVFYEIFGPDLWLVQGE
ncbi:globin domain-containing protein [Raineyella sp. LH-20]|uniref:globin domain-containing protein n=1 Tax=Raineyella sp. LH-20 TaxID=3081204 RepID=UPI002952E211|nr:globin domain-containing protein [Raineyella sp. LH-20]WOP17793.1 globin domain-containing protein [Raineyella sp. LH-20]